MIIVFGYASPHYLDRFNILFVQNYVCNSNLQYKSKVLLNLLQINFVVLWYIYAVKHTKKCFWTTAFVVLWCNFREILRYFFCFRLV